MTLHEKKIFTRKSCLFILMFIYKVDKSDNITIIELVLPNPLMIIFMKKLLFWQEEYQVSMGTLDQ